MPVLYKKWHIAPVDKAKVASLKEKVKLPKSILSILVNREIDNEDAINEFLHPKLKMLPPPDTMKGVKEAVNLICNARKTSQTVAVFGDYDVDGVTSTALLVTFLQDVGFEVKYYHPDRLEGGYGLNRDLISKIGKDCPNGLMITVDCGISEYENVQYANELGLSVIVTDHHLPPETLPKADAIINPLQSDCNFSFKYLSGVGLAFYLVVAVRTRLREEGVLTMENQPNLKNILDLVALGTVADMVPLVGVNRILVKAGLELLNKERTNRKGVASLINICGLSDQDIISNDIGYRIGPRINAAGRIGDARLATDLLVCNSNNRAYELGIKLNDTNEKRKKMASKLSETAMAMAKDQVEQGRNVIVLHGEEWHHGLLGIIASRVVEQFQKPTVILGGAPIAKGSARTIPSINIYETIKACDDLIIQFGGHNQAAGLTIDASKIETFSSCIEAVVLKEGVVEHESELFIDELLEINCECDSYFESYRQLEPFGVGNKEPNFSLAEPCHLRNLKVVGKKGEHLKFSIRICSEMIDGIGFGFGHLADEITEKMVNIVFSIRDNWFRGKKSPQVFLHDIELN